MNDYLTSGRLEDHPFADLAGKLFRESRTGELVLESVQRRRSVWFLGGNPVAVVSEDPQDHIAQILLEHGKISAEDAQRLAALSETREALGKAEYLSKETLNWGVKSRFVNLCYDLFRWEEGDYAFTDGEPPRDLIFLKVPAHSLVFKGVGFLARATVLDAVPDDAVCGAGPVTPDEARYLAPEVRAFLDECRSGRTVADVLEGREDTDQDRRLIYALVCLGLVALAHGPAAEGTLEPAEDQGFTLENESEAVGAPAASHAANVSSTPGPDRGTPQDLDFKLPHLDSEPNFGDASEPLPGPGLSGEGFPFDSDSATGSFPSFDSGLTPIPKNDAQAVPDEVRALPKAGAKTTGSGFRLPRWAGIALGSIAAAAVLGVAGWWWLGGEQPAPPPVRPPMRKPAPAVKPTVPAPPAAPSPAPAPTQAAATAPTPAPPAPAAPPVPARASAPAPGPAPTPAPAAVTPPPRTTAAPALAAGGDRYRSGLELFRAGDPDGAAAIWETLLIQEHHGDFTVLLMTACQGDTIRSVQQALPSQQIYLITKKVNDRGCFRVCAGTFDSRETAGRALAGMPGGYRTSGAAVRSITEVLNRDR